MIIYIIKLLALLVGKIVVEESFEALLVNLLGKQMQRFGAAGGQTGGAHNDGAATVYSLEFALGQKCLVKADDAEHRNYRHHIYHYALFAIFKSGNIPFANQH